MAKAGFCCECGKNVWLKDDGSCEFGHPVFCISNTYDQGRVIHLPANYGHIVFTDRYVRYGYKRIEYKDATSVSSSAIKATFDFSKKQSMCNYVLCSASDSIVIEMTSPIRVETQIARLYAWQSIVSASKVFVEPHIVNHLLDKIFNQKEIVRIGNYKLSMFGFSEIGLFGKRVKVRWDTNRIPSVARSTPNGPIISDLARECRRACIRLGL